MSRRKRPKKSEKSDEEFVLQKAPEKLASPFSALKGLQLEKPKIPPKPAPRPVEPRKPSSPTSDDTALRDAFAGVRPLAPRAARIQAEPTERREVRADSHKRFRDAEDEARARLDALVQGDVRFSIEIDEDGRLRAFRMQTDPQLARRLSRGEIPIESTLDLHGMSGAEASSAIQKFIVDAHRAGARTVCIVHGKGQHSGGAPVLGEVTKKALFQGRSAVLVLAAATPPERYGGLGAVVVRLTK